MLIHSLALSLKSGWCVGWWEFVQGLLNAQPHRRPGLLPLPPVQDQCFGLQRMQHIPGHRLHLLFFPRTDVDTRFGQDVEDCLFIVAHFFPNMTLCFLVQFFGELEQCFVNSLDVG